MRLLLPCIHCLMQRIKVSLAPIIHFLLSNLNTWEFGRWNVINHFCISACQLIATFILSDTPVCGHVVLSLPSLLLHPQFPPAVYPISCCQATPPLPYHHLHLYHHQQAANIPESQGKGRVAVIHQIPPTAGFHTGFFF